MFIDSVVWIGAKLKRDQWHRKSVPIIRKFLDKEIEKVYVTDYIVLETVNFILRKGGFDAALETLNLFLYHERIEIVNIDVGSGRHGEQTGKMMEGWHESNYGF